MPRLTMIYLAFVLLYPILSPSWSGLFSPKHPPVWAQWSYYELRDRHEHQALASLHTAVISGHKIKFEAKLKKALQALHLEHLITPSGLHLSFVTGLFFRFFSRRQQTFALLSVFLLPDFHALKRMALLKILIRTKLTPWHAFLLTMGLDALFGSLHFSPLSFLYSFLFLGSILACGQHAFHIPFALLGAQALVCHLNQQPLFLLGFFLGMVLTWLFGLLFPLLLLDFALLHLPFWPNIALAHYPLKLWWQLTLLSETLARAYGGLEISLLALIGILFFSKRLLKLACLCLLLNSTALWNAPKTKQWHTTLERPERPLKLIKRKYGFETWHEQKRRCRHRHRPIAYEITCN